MAAFFLLTFSFSWSVWWLAGSLVSRAGWGWRIAVHSIGLCGPTVAALVLSGLLYGWQGVSDLLKRIARWRVRFGWYLFALFSSLIIGLTAIGVHTLVGGVTPPMNLQIMQALVPLPSGLPEEYGWRGFALPHLLKKHSALTSSLSPILVGVAHPYFSSPEPCFVLGALPAGDDPPGHPVQLALHQQPRQHPVGRHLPLGWQHGGLYAEHPRIAPSVGGLRRFELAACRSSRRPLRGLASNPQDDPVGDLVDVEPLLTLSHSRLLQLGLQMPYKILKCVSSKDLDNSNRLAKLRFRIMFLYFSRGRTGGRFFWLARPLSGRYRPL